VGLGVEGGARGRLLRSRAAGVVRGRARGPWRAGGAARAGGARGAPPHPAAAGGPCMRRRGRAGGRGAARRAARSAPAAAAAAAHLRDILQAEAQLVPVDLGPADGAAGGSAGAGDGHCGGGAREDARGAPGPPIGGAPPSSLGGLSAGVAAHAERPPGQGAAARGAGVGRHGASLATVLPRTGLPRHSRLGVARRGAAARGQARACRGEHGFRVAGAARGCQALQ
jgi:hypothetical protein